MSILSFWSLLIAPAAADPWYPQPSGFCGSPPRPCIGLLDSDAHIIPSDWLERWASEVGVVRWMRVELAVYQGALDVSVGGLPVTRGLYAPAQSEKGVAVYYVPVDVGGKIEVLVTNVGETTAEYELALEGYAEPTP